MTAGPDGDAAQTARGSTGPRTGSGCAEGSPTCSPSRCRRSFPAAASPGRQPTVAAARASARSSSSPLAWPTRRRSGCGTASRVPASCSTTRWQSLTGLHADPEHGGWLSEPGTVTRKATYDHVHVGLASATALAVGHPAAAGLLGQAVEVIDDAPLGRARPRRSWSRSRPTGPTPRTTAGPTRTCTASRRSSRWGTPRVTRCGTSAASPSPTVSSTALRDTMTGCSPSTSPPTGRAARLQPGRAHAPLPAVRRDVRALPGVGALPPPARRLAPRRVARLARRGRRRPEPTRPRRWVGARRPPGPGLHRRLGRSPGRRRAAALAGL